LWLLLLLWLFFVLSSFVEKKEKKKRKMDILPFLYFADLSDACSDGCRRQKSPRKTRVTVAYLSSMAIYRSLAKNDKSIAR